MTTSAIYGQPMTPAALADEKGNAAVVSAAASPAWLERLLRPLCSAMGCSAGFSSRPLTGQQLRRVVVPHSLSLAWRLGSAAARAQHAKRDAPAAIADAGGGRVLFLGRKECCQAIWPPKCFQGLCAQPHSMRLNPTQCR
jgi:DUF917 family protein